MMKMSYKPFFVILVLSFFTMYSVMFLNVDEASHIYLSLTRFYMSLLMVCPMAIIMLIMMRKMYSNKKLNGAIITVVSLVFIFSLVPLRTQAFVEDRNYMKAMIPHHYRPYSPASMYISAIPNSGNYPRKLSALKKRKLHR